MNTKELAEQTYRDLQKRKAEKARKKEAEFMDYVTKRQKDKKRNTKTWYGRRIHWWHGKQENTKILQTLLQAM